MTGDDRGPLTHALDHDARCDVGQVETSNRIVARRQENDAALDLGGVDGRLELDRVVGFPVALCTVVFDIMDSIELWFGVGAGLSYRVGQTGNTRRKYKRQTNRHDKTDA